MDFPLSYPHYIVIVWVRDVRRPATQQNAMHVGETICTEDVVTTGKLPGFVYCFFGWFKKSKYVKINRSAPTTYCRFCRANNIFGISYLY
jgi:hypothetical protein